MKFKLDSSICISMHVIGVFVLACDRCICISMCKLDMLVWGKQGVEIAFSFSTLS